MLDFTVDPRADVPPSRQIVDAVLDAVATGGLGPNGKLPSVRALAAKVLVNPNTVGKAYRELETAGVVAGRNGLGVFVTEGGPQIARQARRDATLEDVRRAVRSALRAGHDPADLHREIEDHSALDARGRQRA
ncbi:MAG: GntR family transcriptional regulator [Planctomycetota bacterium]